MKRKFVVDENVIILAEKLKDESGNFDVMSLKLVTDIITECHTLVVDPTLQEKYYGIFRRMELNSRATSGPVVTRMITQIQHHRPKYYFVDSASRLEGEETLPDNDVPLVRLAAATHATLVTKDKRLVESVKRSGLQQKYNFDVGSPEEVLALFFHNAV